MQGSNRLDMRSIVIILAVISLIIFSTLLLKKEDDKTDSDVDINGKFRNKGCSCHRRQRCTLDSHRNQCWCGRNTYIDICS